MFLNVFGWSLHLLWVLYIASFSWLVMIYVGLHVCFTFLDNIEMHCNLSMLLRDDWWRSNFPKRSWLFVFLHIAQRHFGFLGYLYVPSDHFDFHLINYILWMQYFVSSACGFHMLPDTTCRDFSRNRFFDPPYLSRLSWRSLTLFRWLATALRTMIFLIICIYCILCEILKCWKLLGVPLRLRVASWRCFTRLELFHLLDMLALSVEYSIVEWLQKISPPPVRRGLVSNSPRVALMDYYFWEAENIYVSSPPPGSSIFAVPRWQSSS